MIQNTTSTSTAASRSRWVNGLPFYYGWVILFAGTVGYILSSPGQTYSVSIFIEHFIEDNWTSHQAVRTAAF